MDINNVRGTEGVDINNVPGGEDASWRELGARPVGAPLRALLLHVLDLVVTDLTGGGLRDMHI